MKRIWFPLACLIGLGICSGLVYCSKSGSSSGSSSSSASRTLLSDQTAGASHTTTYGGSCTTQTLDTSSCESARTALGLSGEWLKFSCNVTLGLADSSGNSTTTFSNATYVTVTFVDLPNYTSNYFPTSGTYSFTANGSTVGGNYSDLNASYTTTYPDPNSISQQSLTMNIPITPAAANSGSGTTMPMGMVGVAVNGIGLYNNLADSTDNIFAEEGSFDQCQGHPSGENSGTYHYHSEPYAISYDDDSVIGVMRDGYFIYGRQDSNSVDVSTNSGTEWTSSDATGMYKFGGHVGTIPGGTTSTFHYHATKWTGCYHRATSGGTTTIYADDGATGGCSSGNGGTAVTAYFLTGHGNGGVFATVPTFTGSYSGYPQSTSQSTAGVRYYYGTPGSCSGCN